MVLYAPPKPNGGTVANVIWVQDRFTKFRVSVRKAARSPHTKSLAPLTTQEHPRSPESQMYIPDGCPQVAGDPAHW
jgi:hypothetical protein